MQQAITQQKLQSLQIPILDKETIQIYDIKLTYIDKIEKILNELKENLSERQTIQTSFSYGDYVSFIKRNDIHQVIYMKNSYRRNTVDSEINLVQYPGIYIILRELFTDGNIKSLAQLTDYLNAIDKQKKVNLYIKTKKERENIESIKNAVNEITSYIEISEGIKYPLDIKTNEITIAINIDNAKQQLETTRKLIEFSKINKMCINSGVLDFIKQNQKQLKK